MTSVTSNHPYLIIYDRKEFAKFISEKGSFEPPRFQLQVQLIMNGLHVELKCLMIYFAHVVA